MEIDNIAKILSMFRASGKKIVFTNGVFDLMHPGHLSLLKQARAMGDFLVVGVNSDASVRSLAKGDDRPLLPEDARRTLLAELRCVDAAIIFDDPTPLELIKLIRPDVLVKGADYADKEVVGRAEVESWGGRVELVPLEPGWSTSALAEKIRKS